MCSIADIERFLPYADTMRMKALAQRMQQMKDLELKRRNFASDADFLKHVAAAYRCSTAEVKKHIMALKLQPEEETYYRSKVEEVRAAMIRGYNTWTQNQMRFKNAHHSVGSIIKIESSSSTTTTTAAVDDMDFSLDRLGPNAFELVKPPKPLWSSDAKEERARFRASLAPGTTKAITSELTRHQFWLVLHAVHMLMDPKTMDEKIWKNPALFPLSPPDEKTRNWYLAKAGEWDVCVSFLNLLSHVHSLSGSEFLLPEIIPELAAWLNAGRPETDFWPLFWCKRGVPKDAVFACFPDEDSREYLLAVVSCKE